MRSFKSNKTCWTSVKAKSSDTEAPFLDLNLSISNGTVSTKIYDKRDDFDFDIVNFPFLDGDVPSYGVNIYLSLFLSLEHRPSSVNIFKWQLLWNHETDRYQISHIASIGLGNE